MNAQLMSRLYRSMRRIRRTEEEIARLYPTDKIKSPIHLSIGQEAVSVGVCEALKPDDVVFGTYRGHAVYLAKGGSLKGMIAELYGKATGCCKGKGGSMHLMDASCGMMGTSAVVATTIPQAVGYAFALQQQKRDAMVVSFFGEGAVDEGVFHESANFAALKRLPILFVCENNLYAIHSHQRARQLTPNLCDRAKTYGLQAERIEKNDILKIYERTRDVANQIRSRASGPWFFECMTYRWKEHVGPNDDWNLGYRTKAEAEPWIRDDQLTRLATMLKDTRAIDQEVDAELQDAIAFAEASPFPDATELYADVVNE